MATKGYTSKAKLGTGTRAAHIVNSVQNEYVKKGYSAKKAAAIGGAVAGMAGRAAHGAKQMTKYAKEGK